MSNLLVSGTLSRSCAPVLILTFGALFCEQAAAQAEVVFGIDWQGQTVGETDSIFGVPITDGDLLIPVGGPFPTPSTPLSRPGVLVPAAFLQAYTACLGHLPGTSCGIEINALSFGRDTLLPNDIGFRFGVYFSVDEHAVGIPSATAWGTVFSEALQNEASADVFLSNYSGIGPFQTIGQPGENSQVMDGDGRRNSVSGFAPGLGLVEPNIPGATIPDTGSNLDALSMGSPFNAASDRIFFSLQGAGPDPLEPTAQFTDSAAIQGFQSADILSFDPQSGTMGVYASADSLGLDLLGPGTDDIDAIIVVEANTTPGFQRPNALYDWELGGGDLVLFSVRRGSGVIGMVDSLLGLPILPGDILMSPIGQGFLGTTPPGIFITAESLGLAANRTTGEGDELDAMDMMGEGEDPFKDCNFNGVEDSKDIANGSSPDDNINGIPDECEDPGHKFCECSSAPNAPCGNHGTAEEGCLNNTGAGGKLVGTGQSSIATDSLILTSSQLPINNFGLLFMGDGTVGHTPIANGLRCVDGTTQGFRRLDIKFTGAGGTFTHGPGILGIATAAPHTLTILTGTTWYCQTWYRDHGGHCTDNSNMTNGWEVTFTP